MKNGNGENGEYRETGYTDTRFEERNMPASHEQLHNTGAQEKPKPWSNNFLKIFLIVAIIVVGAPVVLPLAFAVVCVVLALVFAGFLLLGGLVLAAVAVMISGFVTAVVGIVELFSFPALGLVACGGGMILCVVGLAATVLLVKLCMIVFPIMFRGIVVELFSFPALGLVACGGGMILCVVGLAATVLLVKLCMIVFPIMFRGIVNLCRRFVHGKEA